MPDHVSEDLKLPCSFIMLSILFFYYLLEVHHLEMSLISFDPDKRFSL